MLIKEKFSGLFSQANIPQTANMAKYKQYTYLRTMYIEESAPTVLQWKCYYICIIKWYLCIRIDLFIYFMDGTEEIEGLQSVQRHINPMLKEASP